MNRPLLPTERTQKKSKEESICPFHKTLYFVILLVGGLVFLAAGTSKCFLKVSPAYGYQSDLEVTKTGATTLDSKITEKPKILEIVNDTFCKPKSLVGAISDIDFDMEMLEARYQELIQSKKDFFENGEHKPKDCQVEKLKNVAIIIPFRDMTEDSIRTKQFKVKFKLIISIFHFSQVLSVLHDSNPAAPKQSFLNLLGQSNSRRTCFSF